MCLQNLYQWNERDRKGRWKLGFSLRKKLSLFMQRNGFTLLAPLGFLGFGQYISEASCHAVDSTFYTPYDLGPYSPMMLKF